MCACMCVCVCLYVCVHTYMCVCVSSRGQLAELVLSFYYVLGIDYESSCLAASFFIP